MGEQRSPFCVDAAMLTHHLSGCRSKKKKKKRLYSWAINESSRWWTGAINGETIVCGLSYCLAGVTMAGGWDHKYERLEETGTEENQGTQKSLSNPATASNFQLPPSTIEEVESIDLLPGLSIYCILHAQLHFAKPSVMSARLRWRKTGFSFLPYRSPVSFVAGQMWDPVSREAKLRGTRAFSCCPSQRAEATERRLVDENSSSAWCDGDSGDIYLLHCPVSQRDQTDRFQSMYIFFMHFLCSAEEQWKKQVLGWLVWTLQNYNTEVLWSSLPTGNSCRSKWRAGESPEEFTTEMFTLSPLHTICGVFFFFVHYCTFSDSTKDIQLKQIFWPQGNEIACWDLEMMISRHRMSGSRDRIARSWSRHVEKQNFRYAHLEIWRIWLIWWCRDDDLEIIIPASYLEILRCRHPVWRSRHAISKCNIVSWDNNTSSQPTCSRFSCALRCLPAFIFLLRRSDWRYTWAIVRLSFVFVWKKRLPAPSITVTMLPLPHINIPPGAVWAMQAWQNGVDAAV